MSQELIRSRRSIRKYKNEKVTQAEIESIVELARFAPSWANTQIARYTVIQNRDKIEELCESGVNGFVYNMNTLKNAYNVVALSYVQGKSGKFGEKGEYATEQENAWELFDAGIACQTFCLAAHEKGIGTCIMGIIDAKQIAEIIGLPEEEQVAALLVFGYPDEEPEVKPRNGVKEILRYL